MCVSAPRPIAHCSKRSSSLECSLRRTSVWRRPTWRLRSNCTGTFYESWTRSEIVYTPEMKLIAMWLIPGTQGRSLRAPKVDSQSRLTIPQLIEIASGQKIMARPSLKTSDSNSQKFEYLTEWLVFILRAAVDGLLQNCFGLLVSAQQKPARDPRGMCRRNRPFSNCQPCLEKCKSLRDA